MTVTVKTEFVLEKVIQVGESAQFTIVIIINGKTSGSLKQRQPTKFLPVLSPIKCACGEMLYTVPESIPWDKPSKPTSRVKGDKVQIEGERPVFDRLLGHEIRGINRLYIHAMAHSSSVECGWDSTAAPDHLKTVTLEPDPPKKPKKKQTIPIKTKLSKKKMDPTKTKIDIDRVFEVTDGVTEVINERMNKKTRPKKRKSRWGKLIQGMDNS